MLKGNSDSSSLSYMPHAGVAPAPPLHGRKQDGRYFQGVYRLSPWVGGLEKDSWVRGEDLVLCIWKWLVILPNHAFISSSWQLCFDAHFTAAKIKTAQDAKLPESSKKKKAQRQHGDGCPSAGVRVTGFGVF